MDCSKNKEKDRGITDQDITCINLMTLYMLYSNNLLLIKMDTILTIDSGAETNIDMGMTTRRTKNPKEQSCTHYFNSKWAIVHLSRGENKLLFEEMTMMMLMMTALYTKYTRLAGFL